MNGELKKNYNRCCRCRNRSLSYTCILSVLDS